jgi:hypothetical protein
VRGEATRRITMKKLVIGIGGLVIILVVVALVAPFLIPTDTYRNQWSPW